MYNTVFIVTEQGYWGEECIVPLQELEETGAEITVATPSGKNPAIDARSVDPEQVGEQLSERLKTAHNTHAGLNDPVALSNIHPGDYEYAVFPGGHGTVWDVNTDRDARSILRHMVATGDKKALVICHAVGLLAFTRDSNGEMLVEGCDVTGFPNAWEKDIVDAADCLPDGRKLPYWVEDEVVAAGGHWDAELDSDTSVCKHGDLITARGPGSSHEAVETLIRTISPTGS